MRNDSLGTTGRWPVVARSPAGNNFGHVSRSSRLECPGLDKLPRPTGSSRRIRPVTDWQPLLPQKMRIRRPEVVATEVLSWPPVFDILAL